MQKLDVNGPNTLGECISLETLGSGVAYTVPESVSSFRSPLIPFLHFDSESKIPTLSGREPSSSDSRIST